MAGSTYNYCYAGCHMDWLINNSARLDLGAYAGVVGVDHYWTGQGVPCGPDGLPHEFDMQDALATTWKAQFPGMRFLSYRITSAVPYDAVIHDKIVSDPDYFIRWEHLPGSTSPGNGSVCFNHLSPCFNDPRRINAPQHNCSFEIRAAAYNWNNPHVGEWYLQNVLYPSLVHCDGIWLDGNGFDNGAWMCSGFCCGFGASNSPLNQSMIDSFKAAQLAITTRGRAHIIANGGFDFNCFQYKVREMPQATDSPAACADKVLAMARWAANHSHYDMVVAYGSNEGGQNGYNDTTAAGAVAAFLIVRGQHWLFSIGESQPCNPRHYPVTGRCHSDGCGKPCNASNNQMNPETAKLIVSDYGVPLGPAYAVAGKSNMFARNYTLATVFLDCTNFGGRFVPY
jgi:hypothetical protein